MTVVLKAGLMAGRKVGSLDDLMVDYLVEHTVVLMVDQKAGLSGSSTVDLKADHWVGQREDL